MCAALRLGLWLLLLALVPAANVARAEPFALELRFGPDIGPCFTREQLIQATTERLARPSAPAPKPAPPVLSIQLQVSPGVDGWHASIASERRGSSERGIREIELAPGCAGLLDAMSLVLALIVEQATSEAVAAATAPQAPVAVVPVAGLRVAPRPRAVRNLADDAGAQVPPAVGIAGGFRLGLSPEPAPVLAVTVRVPLTVPRSPRSALPLFVEVGADAFLPREATRDQVRMSMAGTGVEAQLCASFSAGAIGAEPCAGLWLSVLHAAGAGGSSEQLEAATFTLSGWDVGCNLQVHFAAHWSLFATARLLMPFELQTIRLTARGNPSDPDAIERFTLHRVAEIGASLLAGVALSL